MDLVAQWADLLRAEGSIPEDELEAREATLTNDTLAALAAGGLERDALISAFQTAEDSDPDLRHALGSVILPPYSRAARHPEEYRSHPEVRFDGDRMPIRVALGLPVAEDLSEFVTDRLDEGRSWFGGRPAVPANGVGAWEPPRRSDGRMLAHIVQVDLADQAANQGQDIFPSTGLPDDGIIQLFHDLETFGWESADDPTAWRVEWHPRRPRREPALVLARNAETSAHEAPFFPINAQVLPTAPAPLDLDGAGDEEWARYDRAVAWLEQSAHETNVMAPRHRGQRTPWDQDYEPVPPVSRMGGYGPAEINKEVVDVLNEQLPIATAGDSHYLLFDINPLAITDSDALINWFHGGRHLEVWIRKSDLDARAFTNVWCVIRTDN